MTRTQIAHEAHTVARLQGDMGRQKRAVAGVRKVGSMWRDRGDILAIYMGRGAGTPARRERVERWRRGIYSSLCLDECVREDRADCAGERMS